MINHTKHNLKKIENLFNEIGYKVRYEKGNFQSGYCLVKDQKVAIINSFFDTEGRINSLLDILAIIEVPIDQLEPKSAKFFNQLFKAAPKAEEEQQPSNE